MARSRAKAKGRNCRKAMVQSISFHKACSVCVMCCGGLGGRRRGRSAEYVAFVFWLVTRESENILNMTILMVV